MKNIENLKSIIMESVLSDDTKTKMINIICVSEKTSDDMMNQNNLSSDDIDIIKNEIFECRENITQITSLLKNEQFNEAKAKLVATRVKLKKLELLVVKSKADISVNAIKALKQSMSSFIISLISLSMLFKKINMPKQQINTLTGEELAVSKHNREVARNMNTKCAVIFSTLPAIKTGIKGLSNDNWKNELKKEITSLITIINEIEKIM